MNALRFILVLAAVFALMAFAQEVVSSGPALDPMGEGDCSDDGRGADMPVAIRPFD